MIYFIQSGNNGPIKIGHTTKNVEQRVRSLQTASPYPLKIIGLIEGDVTLEQIIHKKLSKFRLRGEWFKCKPEVLKLIEEGAESLLDERIEDMKNLLEKGWTFNKIGGKHGVSRQRVHQLLKNKA